MRSRTNKVLLMLEYVSAFIPLNELRKIVEGLIQDKSFAECKSSLKQSTLGSNEQLITQIFTATQEAPFGKKGRFIVQLNNFLKTFPAIIIDPVSNTPSSRPSHDPKWLEFEQKNYINNNSIGGNRITKIDHYASLKSLLNKSQEWFLAQIYNDAACLSTIQREEFSQTFPDVIALQFEAPPRDRKRVVRLGLEENHETSEKNDASDNNDDNFLLETHESESATLPPAKRSRSKKKKTTTAVTPVLVSKYVLDVLTPQFVHVTNSSDSRYFKKTIDLADGKYLQNILCIPPQDQTKSDEENFQLGLQIVVFLQVPFNGRATANILVQPPIDQRDQAWQEKNTFRNKKGEFVGYTIPTDKPVGTVVVRSTTCGRLKEKLTGHDSSQSEDSTLSSPPQSSLRNSSAFFKAPHEDNIDNSTVSKLKELHEELQLIETEMQRRGLNHLP